MIDDPVEAPAGAAESEPLFVNVTRMDREKYFEAVRARAKSGRSAALVLGGIAVAVIGLLMHSYTVAALGAAVSVLTILSPLLIGRRDFRRLCELHPGGSWEKTVRFYPDRIETDSGGGRVTAAPYGSIRREFESERMYVLDYGRTYPATTFEKSGFTRGSMEELRAFLTEARRSAYAPSDDVDEQG